ncbi:ribose transport system ATP-binding protein [Asanoa hainanensis]|uniref:Ribose transport system ATP-binding protein n=1 Tax=Asanoa hainanensis TaxID=560556 RepID=A0A239P0Z3_9ACTN|nr:sugar ABC transporter ATP-binding protein [Asanoa hainanensis]SNT60284.1 ribose transport system ATP-binding protein [Asanoa hainanensis]
MTETSSMAPAQQESGSQTLAVRASGVDRAFGGVQALRDASFAARPGEIHALAGENGAGKSTLIKVLCGLIKADRGTVEIFGTEVSRVVEPAARRRMGVATAFQELSLLPDLTVAENLLLENPPRGRLGLVKRRGLGPAAEEILGRYGVDDIDPRATAADLSVAQRQVVELVRVLAGEPRVVILDEPTAALADRQVEWLAGHMRQLRDAGSCVIFTSHRWREIEALADRVTVFRNGTHVATRDTLSEAEAVTLMSGRSFAGAYPELTTVPQRESALRVKGLHSGRLHGVDLDLRRGEILGVGGLAGQGQRDLFLTLFGAQKARQGTITLDGKAVAIRSTKDAIRAGIAYVPEDRKAEGLFLPLSIRDNIAAATLSRRNTAGFVRRGAERTAVGSIVDQLSIGKGRSTNRAVDTLSGGNQQKVVMARWLLTDARILLLFDVTRGVDAATKHDIYELVGKLAAQGRAILYYSSETEEIAHLCHRVLVLREGRVAAELAGPVGDAERIVAASIKENHDA